MKSHRPIRKVTVVALTAVMCLVLSSCGLSRSGQKPKGSQGPKSYGSEVDTSEKTPAPEVQATQAPGQQPGGAAKPGQAKAKVTAKPKAGGGAPASHPGVPPDLSGGDLGPTEQAWRILNQATPKMVIEVDVVGEAEPDAQALAQFKAILDGIADKPRGIEVRRETIPGGKSSYSDGEIEEFVRTNRGTKNTGDTASVYVIYVPGTRQGPKPGTLGYASGSRIAMFPDTVKRAAANAPAVGRTKIETGVLTHEMGHIMALLDIGWESPRKRTDPEDPQQPSNHSRNRDSIMYYKAEQGDLVAQALGTKPIQFDADDKADLEDLKHRRV
ncbi:MAG TPA: hypothetical protein VNE62_05860 [Actinomycetota bacterium]|nr:hypothetical protein [Actinomycetota bacterium]